MASSLTGVKRSRSEVVSVYPPVVQNPRQFPKRLRCVSDVEISDLATVLKSDRDALSKFPARAAFLRSLQIPDHAILGLLQGLASDFRSFLSIIDLNLYQPNILAVVNDFAARGVSMTTLNIRGHAFSMADKDDVLTSFASFYGHQRWPCDVATYVAHHVFQHEQCLSINVLSGGGVRDVLMAEWCRTYFTDTLASPPQVIFLKAPSGRLFLIPFLAWSVLALCHFTLLHSPCTMSLFTPSNQSQTIPIKTTATLVTNIHVKKPGQLYASQNNSLFIHHYSPDFLILLSLTHLA